MTDASGFKMLSRWPLVITAAAILMITMGARQAMGLFVSPLNTATGLGIVAISFAMAVGQFAWGASQPIFGAIVDRYGSELYKITGSELAVDGEVEPKRAHDALMTRTSHRTGIPASTSFIDWLHHQQLQRGG